MIENLEGEVWLPIKGYEDRYKVSNKGRVCSIYNPLCPKLLSFQDRGGYYCICLYKNKYKRNWSVHRLVALMFVSNPNNYNYVNHKDENKKNNSAENLEWCTQAYNINYSHVREKHVEKARIPINMFDLKGNLVQSFKSIHEAARYLKTCNSNIKSTLIGRHKTCKGFVFRYADSGLVATSPTIPAVRPVIITTPLGEELFFANQHEAARQLGLIPQLISRCCRNTQSSTKGFKCRFAL